MSFVGVRSVSFLVTLAVILFPALTLMAERQEVKVPVEGRSLSGTLFVPSAPLPAPAVLVLHTRGGLQSDDVVYASELAEAGFVSLVVEYLNPQWEGLLQHPGYTKDLALAFDYLQARPEVQGKPVGIVGFSLGPAHGIRVAAQRPNVKAVVGYYGVYDLRLSPQSKGRQSYPIMPVDVAANVNAPVLLLHGEYDDETPINQAYAMRDALLKAGKTVELVVYSKAYHRFERGPVSGMRGSRSRDGYTYVLDQKAKEDAWNRTLAWFRKYLVSGP